MDTIGVRLQGLHVQEQVLSIARIAQGRAAAGWFAPRDVAGFFKDIGLPQPGDLHRTLSRLVADGQLIRQGTGRGSSYRMTPVGRARSTDLADDMDLATLLTEGATASLPSLGATGHPVIPPSLAPPDLVGPLHAFLQRHPFESNVFGMTRFPDADEEKGPDPVAPALEMARTVCEEHGLTFHLASDRQIVDDLWPNVAAHIWACKYGIAFFEDRRGKGINYNLSIEVGSMIVLGRRMAILKDGTIDAGQDVERLPTDLTGRIYKSVDIDDSATVRTALAAWIRDDLALS